MAVKKVLPIITYDELKELSTEQLQEMLIEYNSAAIIQKNIEQAIKILINSLYGYLGSVWSRFYDRLMAEGITLTGQAIIRTSETELNQYLNKLTGVEKDRVLAIDTDSVISSTILNINNEEISIGEYYDTCNGRLIDDGKETKYILGIDLTPSYMNGEIVENRITYVMRHKVKKNHYKITVGDKSVIVTEDHSVMVLDENNNLIQIKPKDMNIKIHRVIKILKD